MEKGHPSHIEELSLDHAQAAMRRRSGQFGAPANSPHVPAQLLPRASYAEYGSRKMQWQATHPNATQTEYDCAMQRIARECGV